MVETKAKNDMEDAIVREKEAVAVRWCENASQYQLEHGGKKWKYLLVPHDDVKEQDTLSSYVEKYTKQPPSI